MMNKIRQILVMLVAVTALLSCSDDDNAVVVPDVKSNNDSVRVAVILPKFIQEEWKHSIDWAQKNIALAQNLLPEKIVLDLTFYDEDTEDLDALAFRLTHPAKGEDTCHAIIGPYHSVNAQTVLSYAAQNRMPVVMPTCTSAELQRVNARNTYAWFLTESDVTQCELMLQAVKTLGAECVTLVYSDDSYGKSFYDWFSYWTVELGLKIVGGVPTTYKHGDDLTEFFRRVDTESQGAYTHVCMAMTTPEDYVDVTRQMAKVDYENDGFDNMLPMFTDVAMTHEVISSNAHSMMLGICPVGSISNGYPQSYYSYFINQIHNGDPQIYDALTLIAMGACLQKASPDKCIVSDQQVEYDTPPFGPGLTDYMRSIVSSYKGEMTDWTAAGLARAFQNLSQAKLINCEGATGFLQFDTNSNTKILETQYMIWTPVSQEYPLLDTVMYRITPVCYISTDESSTSVSTSVIWEQKKRYEQLFDRDLDVNHNLPITRDNWAVIVSPSTTWSNYRHQADAFAMYQTLRHHGYEDDHIVLIVEDNLAYSPNNKLPGQIFVERSDAPEKTGPFINDDVRSHVTVDYHFSDITRDDIVDIMLGRESARLPHVIHPDSASNVFFFWSGHGGPYEGPLWGNQDAREYFGTKRLVDMVTQMNDADMYRRMMFAVETCFSGKWGEALVGLPDVLVLTAANSIESSKADVHDNYLGVFLSNAFSRTFRQFINYDNEMSIHSLYTELAKTTNGSHVSIYNEKNYGSVFTNTMRDFMPE